MDLSQRRARGCLIVRDQVTLAFSTFPDAEIAARVAGQLVSGSIVACANLLPAVQSIYRWEGKLEKNSEALVLFKLAADQYEAFERELKKLHPYDVPEIVAVPVANGLPDYLAWVTENSQPAGAR